MRWRGLQGVQSPIAIAEVPVSEGQFHFGKCDDGLRSGQYRFGDCRSTNVGGTISFQQMRWAFAQGTISFRRLQMPLCRRDNLISANAEAVCARWSTSIAVAIAVLRKKQSSFRRWKMYFARISNHGSQSRKYPWCPADDGFPFANSSLMVKQLRKPWCENIVVSASQENLGAYRIRPPDERRWKQ